MKKLLCTQNCVVLQNEYVAKQIKVLENHIIDGIDLSSNFTGTGRFIELPDDFEIPDVESKFLVFVEEIKNDEIVTIGIREMTDEEKEKVLKSEQAIIDAEIKFQKSQKTLQNSYDALRLIADFQRDNNANQPLDVLKRAHEVCLALKNYVENFQFKLAVSYLKDLKPDSLLTKERLGNLIAHFEKM